MGDRDRMGAGDLLQAPRLRDVGVRHAPVRTADASGCQRGSRSQGRRVQLRGVQLRGACDATLGCDARWYGVGVDSVACREVRLAGRLWPCQSAVPHWCLLIRLLLLLVPTNYDADAS